MSIHFLKHHGVQGQKWGERNGPPYPLDPNKATQAQRKANYTPEKKTDRVIGSQRDLDKAAKLKTKASKYDVKAANYKAKSAKALTKNQNQTAAKFYLKSAKAEKASAKANLKAEKLIDKDKREKEKYTKLTDEQLSKNLDKAYQIRKNSYMINNKPNNQRIKELEGELNRRVSERREQIHDEVKQSIKDNDMQKAYDNLNKVIDPKEYYSEDKTGYLYRTVRENMDVLSREEAQYLKNESKKQFDEMVKNYVPTKDSKELLSKDLDSDSPENQKFFEEISQKTGDWYNGVGKTPSSKLIELNIAATTELAYKEYPMSNSGVETWKNRSAYIEKIKDFKEDDDAYLKSALMDLGYPITTENMKKIRNSVFWD